jgi:TDG/mug DNA glycosylase family protein
MAGFTDVRLQASEEQLILSYGCGITAVINRPTKQARQVSAKEAKEAQAGFEAMVRAYAPRSIAFLGKRALSVMVGKPTIAWGRQSVAFAGLQTWVLPNPGGLNRGVTTSDLVRAFAELREALSQSTV